MATYGPEDLASRELSCPICFEDYNGQNTKRIPKLLPCLHTFCSDCTKKLWKSNGSIECSMCRMLHEEVKLDDLLDNYVIVEHLRKELEKRDHELAMRIDQGLCDLDLPILKHKTLKYKATKHRPTPSIPQTVCIQPTKKRQRQEFLCCSSQQEPSTSYTNSPTPPPRKCKKTRRFSKFPTNHEEWTKIGHSIASLQATVMQVTAAIQKRTHAKQHACSTAVSHFRSHNS